LDIAMSATPSDLQLRIATPADVPLILKLINELAEFEHLSHEVTATEPLLHEHLFSARPYAEVLLAYVADEPAGFALYFHNYSTFLAKPGIYLEDLYVRDHFRAQGVGTALLTAVGQLALDRGCGRYEWSVLSWNKRAIDFYEKMGARALSEWTVYRVTGEALHKFSLAAARI
jgi:GNAT superfamily N-acetyltransferase